MEKFVFTSQLLQKICAFNESESGFFEKKLEDMVSGQFNEFTGEAVVNETFIRGSSNSSKSMVGIDASQLYSYYKCPATPAGLFTKWELVSESGKTNQHQKGRGIPKTWSCPFFRESDRSVNWKVSTRQSHKKN